MHVLLKEKWLRVTVHEPDAAGPGALSLTSTPAQKRPIKSVVLCGKLAFRVRAADGEEPDWEVTDVFDATHTPRRAVRLHLRKRAPGENFVPSRKPEWDLQYDGAGVWRESIVKVWWDRLMKHDAPIPLSSLPDRQHQRAAEMQENWRQANEQFKRDVLDIRPVDLSPLLVESAQETERARVKADLAASGVAPGCAEWEEALTQVPLSSLRMYGRPSIAQGSLGRVTVWGFCLSSSPSVSPSVSACLPACVSVCVCQPVCLSASLPACVSVSLCVCLHVCQPVCLPACVSVCMSASLCVCVCLSVCGYVEIGGLAAG